MNHRSEDAMTIEYRVGNMFDDMSMEDETPIVIAHIVNNVGAFGRGFAASLAEVFPFVKTHYHANFSWYKLGDVLMKDADEEARIVVANLFAQDGLPSKDNPTPIKYLALAQSLGELAQTLEECWDQYEVWMPRIGTGYARGKWEVIEPIINQALPNTRVVVYDLS